MSRYAAQALVLVVLSSGAFGCCRHHVDQPPAAPQPQPAQQQVDDTHKFLISSRGIRGPLNYDWTLVHEVAPAPSAALAQLPQLAGQWTVQGSEVVATGGEENRTILLAPSGYDPVRIEVEVTLRPEVGSRIGDITFLLNTSNDAGYWKSGYALTSGSFWNNCTTFYRHGLAIARTEYSPLKPGRRHLAVLEYDQGHIRYWLDDEILLEAWDQEPLAMTADRWIGLRTWHTDMTLHAAGVYTAERKQRKRAP